MTTSRFRMRFSAVAAVLAAFWLILPVAPAFAQTKPLTEVSLAFFADRLSPYGVWLRHPVWGEVWQPNAAREFRPYFDGSWELTNEYGWLWVSNEPFGDIVCHYGRFIFDPDYGWLWVPGYVWGPGWVVWRATPGYVGWLPMPPAYTDFEFGPGSASYALDGSYGYQNYYGNSFVRDGFFNLWLFMGESDFAKERGHRFVTDKRHLRDLYRRSHDRTHYRNEKDRVADRSMGPGAMQREPRSGGQFIAPDVPVTSITEGRAIARERWLKGAPGRGFAREHAGPAGPDATAREAPYIPAIPGALAGQPRRPDMQQRENRDRRGFARSRMRGNEAPGVIAGENEAVDPAAPAITPAQEIAPRARAGRMDLGRARMTIPGAQPAETSPVIASPNGRRGFTHATIPSTDVSPAPNALPQFQSARPAAMPPVPAMMRGGGSFRAGPPAMQASPQISSAAAVPVPVANAPPPSPAPSAAAPAPALPRALGLMDRARGQ